jgi:hypothetical protein
MTEKKNHCEAIDAAADRSYLRIALISHLLHLEAQMFGE